MGTETDSEINTGWPVGLGQASQDMPRQNLQIILDSAAQLLASAQTDTLPATTCAFIRRVLQGVVEIQHNAVYEFRRGLQPKALFFEGCGYDSDLKHYLNGMYLLDPFYDLFENQNRMGILHFSASSRDDLESSKVFEQYWRQIGFNNEIGGLFEISADRCIHISFQFNTDDDAVLSSIISLIRATETILKTAFLMRFGTASEPDAGDDKQRYEIHAKVSETLRDFGKHTLTERDRMLAQLMLKGHSAKNMARLLEISPGTASIHRSNIYRKMAVTSAGELFGMFLAELVEEND